MAARARLDFKRIKAGADFVTILARTGVQVKRDGAELLGLCPFHDDHRPSFRVNPKKAGGVFHCFSCGASGNVLDYVVRHQRLTIRQAAERIIEWCGLPSGEDGAGVSGERRRTAPAAAPDEPTTTPGAKDALPNRPLTFSLKLDPSHPYLSSRRLDPDTIAHFGLGYCSRGMMAGRICIPIHDEEGALVAYAGRYASDDVPENESKYLLPPGFKKTEVLFNLHRVRGAAHLTLVEGYWSVFRLHELGIPAVALMGRTLSPRQEELLSLSHVRRLTLLLDGDDPGREAAREMLPHLASGLFVRVADFGPDTQPDRLPTEKLQQLLENKEDPCP